MWDLCCTYALALALAERTRAERQNEREHVLILLHSRQGLLGLQEPREPWPGRRVYSSTLYSHTADGLGCRSRVEVGALAGATSGVRPLRSQLAQRCACMHLHSAHESNLHGNSAQPTCSEERQRARREPRCSRTVSAPCWAHRILHAIRASAWWLLLRPLFLCYWGV